MKESQMGGALEHWFGFQEKIGRSFMMNEDSIKYPLADYLVNGGEQQVSSIELQHPHPNFPARLMDIAIVRNKIIENAFELKVAKSVTRVLSEKQRIFNDLIRMHLSSQVATQKCYFIIVGKSIHFTRDFRDLNENNIKFYDKWFSFTVGSEVDFDVNSETDATYKNIYDEFVTTYKGTFQKTAQANASLQLPSKITTTCEFVTAFKAQFVPYMAGIWSVK